MSSGISVWCVIRSLVSGSSISSSSFSSTQAIDRLNRELGLPAFAALSMHESASTAALAPPPLHGTAWPASTRHTELDGDAPSRHQTDEGCASSAAASDGVTTKSTTPPLGDEAVASQPPRRAASELGHVSSSSSGVVLPAVAARPYTASGAVVAAAVDPSAFGGRGAVSARGSDGRDDRGSGGDLLLCALPRPRPASMARFPPNKLPTSPTPSAALGDGFGDTSTSRSASAAASHSAAVARASVPRLPLSALPALAAARSHDNDTSYRHDGNGGNVGDGDGGFMDDHDAELYSAPVSARPAPERSARVRLRRAADRRVASIYATVGTLAPPPPLPFATRGSASSSSSSSPSLVNVRPRRVLALARFQRRRMHPSEVPSKRPPAPPADASASASDDADAAAADVLPTSVLPSLAALTGCAALRLPPSVTKSTRSEEREPPPPFMVPTARVLLVRRMHNEKSIM